MTYPLPEERAGFPFADPNLKLTVIGALLDAGRIDLDTPDALAKHVLGRDVDLEEEGYEPIQAVYDYLVRYPLTQDNLLSLDALAFDGGNSAYQFVWYLWDGEDDYFSIQSLEGIGACANIRSIADSGILVEGIDLRPLGELPNLEHLSLNFKRYGHEEALTSFTSLRALDCFSDRFDPAVLETLRAKNITIKAR